MAEVYYPHPDHGDPAGSVTEKEYAEGLGYGSPSGLYGHPADPMPLFLSGGVLYVRAGTSARLSGMSWSVTAEDLPVEIADNGAGSARPDHVVVRLSWSSMEVKVAVRQGTAGGALPAPVQQRSSGVFEVPLGSVTVPATSTVASASIARTCWYIGPYGQYRFDSSGRVLHSPGTVGWEVNTGRGIVSTGSQWWVFADNETSQVTLSAGNWTAPQFNRLRKRNGWVFMSLSPQRIAGNLVAGQTSTVGTVPTGFRPNEDFEFVAAVPSSTARVIGKITTAGVITLTFWGAGIDTNRFVNLQALSWPALY